MSNYTFSNLLGCNMGEIATMFNAGFAEYFMPFNGDAAWAAGFTRVAQSDLQNSVAMHSDGGEFVGLSLLAVRGQRGWVAGFGVALPLRGQGVGKRLLQQQIAVARELGLQTLQLEVLTQNERAIKLYEGAGFTRQYGHIELEIVPAELEQHVTTAKITTAEPEKLHDWLLQGRQPVWYRERSSLVAIGGEAVVTMRPGGATAAIIYRQRTRRDGGTATDILAAALIDRLSANDLALLIRHAGGDKAEIELTDLPGDLNVLAACRDLGFRETWTQHEMMLTL